MIAFSTLGKEIDKRGRQDPDQDWRCTAACADAGMPDIGPTPSGTYDTTTLYWRHELLHRRVLRDFSARCFIEADRAEKAWLDRIAGTGVKRTNSLPYRIAWNGFNRIAEMPDSL